MQFNAKLQELKEKLDIFEHNERAEHKITCNQKQKTSTQQFILSTTPANHSTSIPQHSNAPRKLLVFS